MSYSLKIFSSSSHIPKLHKIFHYSYSNDLNNCCDFISGSIWLQVGINLQRQENYWKQRASVQVNISWEIRKYKLHCVRGIVTEYYGLKNSRWSAWVIMLVFHVGVIFVLSNTFFFETSASPTKCWKICSYRFLDSVAVYYKMKTE